MPLPLPFDPLATVNHDALLAADQPQPSALLTSNVPVPPLDGSDADVDDNENEQPWPWLTVKVRPAIVTVPERPGPFVPEIVRLTVPLPEPLAPDVTVIHETLLLAVQAQPVPAVTETLPLPPEAGTDCVSGAIANEQPLPCVTATVWPATISVPDRLGPAAAATENVTVPDPLPLEPDVIVIHGCALEAVQAHPAPPATFTVRLPPEASTLCESGDTSNEQPADCVTVTALPAIVTVPVRDGPDVGATLSVTVPAPMPVAGATVIQSALLEAVHGHPAPLATVTACDPPADPVA